MNWKTVDPYEPLPPAESPADMRAALEGATHRQHLVRHVLYAGRHRGLNGEDLYVMLAYHAMQQLVATQRRLHDLVANMPPQPVYLDPGKPI